MEDFYTEESITNMLKGYNVDFYCEQENFDMSVITKTILGEPSIMRPIDFIPYIVILEMLGLKKDKGHLYLIKSLYNYNPEWLKTYFQNQRFYDIHDNSTGIIDQKEVYLLLSEILDGLK